MYLKRNGFTLIEISVILFIIGLVGVLIFPKLEQRLFDVEYRSALRRLTNDIKQIFNVSALKGITYYFVFDLDKEVYWVALPDKEGNISDDADTHLIHREMPEGTDIVDIEYGSRIFSEGRNIILFTPTGLEGKYYIHLKRKKDKLTVIIHPLTGKAEIVKGFKSPVR
ncbi:MAG: hypothetical protein D6734_10265 [Candidatus Schekmanbacteria bacterium]|nr:MAG: hypothetical protein D6734_10265 [Candidatus Schekmanbacteria bacterium]